MKTIRAKVEAIIQEELTKSGVTVDWNMNEIHVLPNTKTVVEHTSSEGSLSQALIAHFFPSKMAGVEVAHFTCVESFRSIISSNELRLYSLLKRVNEQEFRPFSEDLGLDGYLDDSEGEPYYRTLMGELFYSSFTDVEPHDPNFMWNLFGDQGKGVKIIFRVYPIRSRSEIRPVKYSSRSETAKSLIRSIMRRIEQECGRHFIMRGISRIGAFYLPLGYSLEQEKETRLVVKSWWSGPAQELVSGHGDEAYLPLTLGNQGNEFCRITIVEVQSGPNSDNDEIDRVLATSGSSGIRRTYA